MLPIVREHSVPAGILKAGATYPTQLSKYLSQLKGKWKNKRFEETTKVSL